MPHGERKEMLFPDWFLEKNNEETVEEEVIEEKIIDNEEDLLKELEDLIHRGILDVEDADIYSDKMTIGVENLDSLGNLYEKISKAKSEAVKAKAQVLEAKVKQKPLIGDQTIARFIGILASFGIIVFWTGVEQGRPAPMRIVRFCESMTIPKL